VTARVTVETATVRGDGRRNQDTVIVTDRAVAVLDGATSWSSRDGDVVPDRDGGWYSRTLAAELLPRLDGDEALVDVVGAAISRLRDNHGLTPGRGPESTVTIARWDCASVELYALGDSPVVVVPREGSAAELLDDRLQSVAARERAAYRDRLRAGTGHDDEFWRLVARLQEAEFTGQNRPGGYWIATADPDAANQALTSRHALADVRAVIVLSDGAATGVDDYASPDAWDDAVDQLDRLGPTAFLIAVHAVEDSDPDARRWPRAKCHDDKTIAVLRPWPPVAGAGHDGLPSVVSPP
jgi:hypothetical protein